MKILALSPNYKYHQDVLEALYERGVIAEFATSHKADSEKDNREFYKKHGTKLIDGQAFYRIKTIQKIVPYDAPALDKQVLDYMEQYERDFYTISDRYAYFPKTFRYRKRIFRHAIRYWLDFYARNNIDGVFSICTPHNIPDYLAFHVARYLGIKTYMTTDVMINDHVLLLDSYTQSFKVPEDYMEGKTNEEILGSINWTLSRKAFAESNEIAMAKRWNDKMLGLKNLNATQAEEKKSEKAKKLKKKAGKYVSIGAVKPKFKAAFAMNGLYSDMTRRMIRIKCGIRLKKLKAAYEEVAVYPDFGKRYAYFAMHLNPERTTQPEAEIFEDHLLAIEILAKSLPDDWVVYVKENPSQYGRKLNLINGKHYRDATDYADFTRLPNVKLIRQDVKTADLINNASLVASLKGSVGWESMNNGKACLIFANAWYSACRNAFRADDVASCKKAIRDILHTKPQEIYTNKLKFFSYMQDRIILGSMGGHFNLDVATEPYENLVKSLADNLEKRFKESA